MKKIIINTAVLLSLTILALIVLSMAGNEWIERKADFKVDPEIRYAVFGHSHPETAYNDSVIKGMANFASSGESYFYTYQKVKSILDHNRQIDTVLIEFSNNQVNAVMDNWIWDDMHLDNKYLNFEPFIDFSDQILLLKNNPKKFINVFLLSRKRNVKRILEGDYYFSRAVKFGGYNDIEISKVDSLSIGLNRPRALEYSEDYPISKANLNYLEKIISYCESINVKVYLIRSPLHNLYKGLANEENYNYERLQRFKDVDYLDFKDFSLTNEEFADLEHLNTKGALKFSNWFNDFLNTRQGLKSENPGEKVREEIKEMNKIETFDVDEMLKVVEGTKYDKVFKLLLESETPVLKDEEFIPGIASQSFYLRSDANYRYVLIHLKDKADERLFNNRSFGVHGVVYPKDFDKRPRWLKQKNSDLLTFKIEPEIIEMNNENFILLSIKKKCEIDEFEYLRLFVQDNDQFRDVIGNAVRLDKVNFNPTK